ncbi:MAG: lamin tail domain-containing protein, partial [Bacteroidales bacterium]|nr:lamin tail domain-containing protein [Bacteroidales bacterium]
MRTLFFLIAFIFNYAIIFAQPCTELFFSEYIEGSSFNKALEIFNPTDDTIFLANYKVSLYVNGGVTPSNSIQLSGSLAPHDVFVIANSAAALEITAQADLLHSVASYNGNDAVVLQNTTTGIILDIIGVIGQNPGINWQVGSGATSEFTLVRKIDVQEGTINWILSATQWDVYPQNTFTYLGSHTITPCCSIVTGTLFSFSDVKCFGDNNGMAVIQATGGDTLTYTWTPSGGSDDTATGLAPGIYDCIIANKCGNSDTVEVTIGEPMVLTASLDSTITPGCSLSDGTLGIIVNGGTPGYTYLWTEGQTTALIDSIASGDYHCVITDTNGCKINFDYTLDNPEPPIVTLSFTSSDTSCSNPSGFILTGE